MAAPQQRLREIGELFGAENPVLLREYRSRFRSGRAFLLVLAFCGLVTLLELAEYRIFLRMAGTTGVPPPELVRQLSRLLLSSLACLQGLLLVAIAPGMTSASITVERELDLYEVLITSPLRGTQLVLGKLLAVVGFLGVLLGLSVPLVGVTLLLGGVAPEEILAGYLINLSNCVLYASVGVLCSAFARSTVVAAVIAYGLCAALYVGQMCWSSLDLPRFLPLAILFSTDEFRAIQSVRWAFWVLPAAIPAALVNLGVASCIVLLAMGALDRFRPPKTAWIWFFPVVTGWMVLESITTRWLSHVLTSQPQLYLEARTCEALVGVFLLTLGVAGCIAAGTGISPAPMFRKLAVWMILVALALFHGTATSWNFVLRVRPGQVWLPAVFLLVTSTGVAALGLVYAARRVTPTPWVAVALGLGLLLGIHGFSERSRPSGALRPERVTAVGWRDGMGLLGAVRAAVDSRSVWWSGFLWNNLIGMTGLTVAWAIDRRRRAVGLSSPGNSSS